MVLEGDICIGEAMDVPGGLLEAFSQCRAFAFVDGDGDALYIMLLGEAQRSGIVGGAVIYQYDFGGVGLELQPLQKGGDMFFQQVAAVVNRDYDADFMSGGASRRHRGDGFL